MCFLYQTQSSYIKDDVLDAHIVVFSVDFEPINSEIQPFCFDRKSNIHPFNFFIFDINLLIGTIVFDVFDVLIVVFYVDIVVIFRFSILACTHSASN